MIRRDFDPAVDYAGLTALFNAARPDEPRSLAHIEMERELLIHGYLARQVLSDGSRLIGEVSLRQWAQWAGTGRYWLTLTLHPDLQLDAGRDLLYDWALAQLQALGAVAVISGTRSDRPRRLAFLQDRGFVIAQEDWISVINLSDFRPDRFRDRVAGVIAGGIDLQPLAALQKSDPDWFSRLHEVDNAVHADVPDVVAYTPRTADQLRRRLEAPDIMPDAFFIAVDRGHQARPYVGLSRLGQRTLASDRLATGMTGVRRAYRRRGIALALKVTGLTWARDQGYQRVDTSNEKNNPMFQLNRQLGFQPNYAKLVLEKRL